MYVTPMTPSNEKRATVSAPLKLTRDGIPPWLRLNPLVRAIGALELRRGPFEIQLDGTSVGSIKRHETVETRSSQDTTPSGYAGRVLRLPLRTCSGSTAAR